MADPLSILGCVAATGQILSGIATSVIKLRQLREKYKDANGLISGMMQRLSTIKAAIGVIKDSIENESIISPDEGLQKHMSTAIDGCQEAMLCFSIDLSRFSSGEDGKGFSFTERTKFILLEKTMRDHEHGLLCHVQALQLLKDAVQSRTVLERNSVLKNGESDSLFQRVEEDAISLRESRTRSATNSVATMSIRGTIVSAEAIEQMSISSGPGPPARASASQRKTSRILTPNLSADILASNQVLPNSAEKVASFLAGTDSHKGTPSGSVSTETPRNNTQDDEGYETRSPTETNSTHLSAIWTPTGDRRRGIPTDTDSLPEGSDIYRPRSGERRLARTETPEHIRIMKLEEKQRRLLRRPSTWFNLNKRRTSDDPQSPSQSTESIRSKPRSRHVSRTSSIDFTTEDGLSAPALVRAAQAGSRAEVEQLLDRGADLEAKHERSGRNALAVAAHCGNHSTVDILLQFGANPNCKDALGSTPLHLAASRDHVDAANLLIDFGARVDERDTSLRTPLWIAADQGHLDVVKLLLSRRAKVNSRSGDETTVLHAAIKNGDISTVELLIAYGAHADAKDGESLAPIHYACERGFASAVEILIRERAGLEATGRNQMTPILSAAAAGQTHIVEILIKRKANINKKGEDDMTALHWASFRGHFDTVDALTVNKRLPINGCTIRGQTPLHLAVRGMGFDVVELLLRRKADKEARCSDGFTPLHYACTRKGKEIVRLLINSGANIEAVNKRDGARPLHIAAEHNDLDAVRTLLSKSPNLDARDSEGIRPLLIACRDGHVEIAQVLLDAGSSMRAKFNETLRNREDSPLCIAARDGRLEICEMLISRGASVREKDEIDWKPLRYAAYHAHPEIVRLLLSHGAELGVASSDWGFPLNGERIGFTDDKDISQERKDAIQEMLFEAEQREAQQRAENDHAIPHRSGTINRNDPSELFGPDIAHIERARTSQSEQSSNREMPNPRFAQGIYRSKTKLAPPPPQDTRDMNRALVPQAVSQTIAGPRYAPSASAAYGDYEDPPQYQAYNSPPTDMYNYRSKSPSLHYSRPPSIVDTASSRSSSVALSQDGSQPGVLQRSATMRTQGGSLSAVARSMSGGLRYKSTPSPWKPGTTLLGQIEEDSDSCEALPGQLTFSDGAFRSPMGREIFEMGPSEPSSQQRSQMQPGSRMEVASTVPKTQQASQIWQTLSSSTALHERSAHDNWSNVTKEHRIPYTDHDTSRHETSYSSPATHSNDQGLQSSEESYHLEESVGGVKLVPGRGRNGPQPRPPPKHKVPHHQRFSWELDEESEGETEMVNKDDKAASPSALSPQQKAHLLQPLQRDGLNEAKPEFMTPISHAENLGSSSARPDSKRMSVTFLEQMIQQSADDLD